MWSSASSRAARPCRSSKQTAPTVVRSTRRTCCTFSRAIEVPMSEIIPLGAWVDHGVHYLLDHDAKTFDSIGKVIESFAAIVEHGLQAVPMWALMAFFVGIGLWRGGGGFAVLPVLRLLLFFRAGF